MTSASKAATLPKALRIRLDLFTLLLLGVVALATVLPVQGGGAVVAGWATNCAIALLFFLQGAKLSRQAILAGAGNWRLHLLVFASSFILFPLLGLACLLLSPQILSPQLAAGFLFLSLLPSTVQSSIAFTSLAGGNVPAAICSASASNLAGIFLTPLLAAVLMNAHGSGSDPLTMVRSLVVQLLAPFILGHLLRDKIGPLLLRHRHLSLIVDRGSILLVVYSAFSAAVVEGLWHRLDATDLAVVILLSIVLFGVMLGVTSRASHALGLPLPDRIVAIFCGSKKSLVTGVPLAGLLFPPAAIGVMIVPLMLYHQVQLIACAVIARRFAEKKEEEIAAAAGSGPRPAE